MEEKSVGQELGDAVRRQRKLAGAPIVLAARIAKVSVQFFHDLESAKPNLRLAKAMEVAGRLGVRVAVTQDEKALGAFAREVARERQRRRDDELREFHRRVIELLGNADAARRREILGAARLAVDRWQSEQLCSPRYILAWRRALDAGAQGVREATLDDARWGLPMMQNSPFGALRKALAP